MDKTFLLAGLIFYGCLIAGVLLYSHSTNEVIESQEKIIEGQQNIIKMQDKIIKLKDATIAMLMKKRESAESEDPKNDKRGKV